LDEAIDKLLAEAEKAAAKKENGGR
jgi:hypothetical protein